MKVIIAGAGSVGRYMAGQLQDSGHSVTLIDNDTASSTRSVRARLSASHGGSAMHARSPR